MRRSSILRYSRAAPHRSSSSSREVRASRSAFSALGSAMALLEFSPRPTPARIVAPNLVALLGRRLDSQRLGGLDVDQQLGLSGSDHVDVGGRVLESRVGGV